MTTKEILIAARDRIKQGWTRNAYARTAEGIPCYGTDSEAVCWCSFGAIEGAAGRSPSPEKESAIRALAEASGKSIIGWNDTPGRTQEEVIETFDKAIAACGDGE